VVVRFNPWLFNSEERLLSGFFETLAAALGRSMATEAVKLGGMLRDYGIQLPAASLSVEGATPVSSSDAIKGVGESLSRGGLDEPKGHIGYIANEN